MLSFKIFLEIVFVFFNRCLDMGFEPQLRKILGQVRPDRQVIRSFKFHGTQRLRQFFVGSLSSNIWYIGSIFEILRMMYV